jgi:hypothetical protein
MDRIGPILVCLAVHSHGVAALPEPALPCLAAPAATCWRAHIHPSCEQRSFTQPPPPCPATWQACHALHACVHSTWPAAATFVLHTLCLQQGSYYLAARRHIHHPLLVLHSSGHPYIPAPAPAAPSAPWGPAHVGQAATCRLACMTTFRGALCNPPIRSLPSTHSNPQPSHLTPRAAAS